MPILTISLSCHTVESILLLPRWSLAAATTTRAERVRVGESARPNYKYTVPLILIAGHRRPSMQTGPVDPESCNEYRQVAMHPHCQSLSLRISCQSRSTDLDMPRRASAVQRRSYTLSASVQNMGVDRGAREAPGSSECRNHPRAGGSANECLGVWQVGRCMVGVHD